MRIFVRPKKNMSQGQGILKNREIEEPNQNLFGPIAFSNKFEIGQ